MNYRTDRLYAKRRTALGYLDVAIDDLLRQAEATGRASEPVEKAKRAILQRVRRIANAARKGEP